MEAWDSGFAIWGAGEVIGGLVDRAFGDKEKHQNERGNEECGHYELEDEKEQQLAECRDEEVQHNEPRNAEEQQHNEAGDREQHHEE